MDKERKFFEDGYDSQCWGYPLLDHAWGMFGHPKKYQKFYRNGQVQAFLDGKAEIPWFVKEAYKLFRVLKSGDITSLFINKTERLEYNKWLEAKPFPTKGYKFRPFWHCTNQPVAPHLTEKGRIWKKVLMEDFEEFNRPEHQGGLWYLANKIKIL